MKTFLIFRQKVSSLVKNEIAHNDDLGKTSRDNCCSDCGKKFKAQIDFVLHYSKTHLNKNFPCPVSDYSNHLNTEYLNTGFISILDIMGARCSNGKVM